MVGWHPQFNGHEFEQLMLLMSLSNSRSWWWTGKPDVLQSTGSQRIGHAMAPHSSTVAWKIPWMEEPGRLQSIRSLRVGRNWATSLSLSTFMHWKRKWQPTPVFLPGESHGRRSLIGCSPWVAQNRTRLKRLSSSSSRANWTELAEEKEGVADEWVQSWSSSRWKKSWGLVAQSVYALTTTDMET